MNLIESARAALLEGAKVSFTPTQMEFLEYLVHDKEHVMNNSNPDRTMESILKKFHGSHYTKPLYRGTNPKFYENLQPGTIITFNRYQSFSDRIEVAKKFSRGLIFQADESWHGFDYGQTMINHYEKLRKSDPESFDSVDGDFMIQSFKDEAEHIFPFNTKFQVDRIEGQMCIGKILP